METPQAINDLQAIKFIKRRRIWKPFMEKYDCQVICELGIFEGHNFIQMTEHNPKIAIAIDSFINDPSGKNCTGYSQETLDSLCDNFKKIIAARPFSKFYREFTHNAVTHFPDEYFDLIYIDADHSYESVKQDIEDWFPKLKKGKFLIGDDYVNSKTRGTGVKFGVIEAVNEFAKNNKLTVYKINRLDWVIIK